MNVHSCFISQPVSHVFLYWIQFNSIQLYIYSFPSVIQVCNFNVYIPTPPWEKDSPQIKSWESLIHRMRSIWWAGNAVIDAWDVVSIDVKVPENQRGRGSWLACEGCQKMLLMEEIRLTILDVYVSNPVNHGIINWCRISEPSTVWLPSAPLTKTNMKSWNHESWKLTISNQRTSIFCVLGLVYLRVNLPMSRSFAACLEPWVGKTWCDGVKGLF